MKGDVKLQTELIMGLIIGVIIVIILFKPIKSYGEILFSKQPICHDTITKNSFSNLIQSLNSLQEQKKEVLQIRDKDCTLIAFNKESGAPTNYFYKTTLCLCESTDISSCKINILCQEINFDKININGFDDQQIIPSEDEFITELTLKKEGSNLIICSKDNPLCVQQIVPFSKLTPQQVRNNIKLNLLYIIEANNKYQDVSITLIEAVIAQESNGVYDVVSDKGAVGLMQLIPGTARDLGLNVPEYSESECKYSKLTCNTILDERFDQEKNIIAGASYLSKLLKDPLVNGNVNLALAAYNGGTCNTQTGEGALCQSTKCPGKLAYECELNIGYQQTRDYVPLVLAYKQDFDTTAIA